MPQNKRKKTFNINEFVDMVNKMLEQDVLPVAITSGVSAHTDENGEPIKYTLEDAYCIALCNVVENILYETGRYKGFMYDTEKFPDPMQPTPLERWYYKYED